MRKVLSVLFKIYRRLLYKTRIITGRICEVQYGDIKNHAKVVFQVKERSIERIEMPKVFGYIKDGYFNIIFPEINLWRFENAIVFEGSDFVKVKDHIIVWPKKDYYNFPKNICRDHFLYQYDYNSATIKTPKRIIKVDKAYSMLGVHCDVWSHALCEYIPKLAQVKKLLSYVEGDIVLLIPEYTDDHLREVVFSIINGHDRVKPLIVNEGEAIQVKELFYMERPCRFTDHEKYVEIGDSVQPKLVAEICKEFVSEPLINKYANNNTCDLKVFLSRKSGRYRMILNNEEIENYFRDKGYIFIEPHKLTLSEKVELFHNAKCVVGSFSSAFSNLLFCRENTKVLVFSNYSRTFENYLTPFEQYFGIDFHWVIGCDNDILNPAHSSFYLPLEDVKAACKEFGID